MQFFAGFLLLILIVPCHAQTIPQPRNNAMMVFHDGLKEVLIYGGSSHSRSSVSMRDSVVWSWNGARWKKFTVAPSLRADAALAYDSKTQRVLLHGGAVSFSREKSFQYSDTWSFDGKSWTRIDKKFPAGHLFHSAATFSSEENALILFGGYNADKDSINSDTWVFTSSGWKKLALTGDVPSARNLHSLVYDSNTKSVFLLGGDQLKPEAIRDMWRLKDRTWTRLTDALPFELLNTQGAVVITKGDIIAFAGSHHTNKSETWLWHKEKNQWTKIDTTNPSPRNNASLCFDPVRNCIVLFGGEIGIESVNELWELSIPNLTWKQIKY